MTTMVDATPRATRREWLGLAVLALPTLLLSLDLSVLYLALPHLSADLDAGATQQLWITDIYGFMIAGLLVTMGNLGDRIGRRRLLLIGAAAFSVASVLAAYSTSAEMLIGTRALLGVAGATLMPSTMALITTMFADPRQRGVAIACYVSCFMGGVALGPVVGGAMLQAFWWGSAFLLGVPVMALLLICGPLLLPESRGDRSARLDPLSVALSLAAILPVVYGLKETARSGWQPGSAAAMLAGAAVAVVFIARQRKLTHPLLDLSLFNNKIFSTALVTWMLFGGLSGGCYLLVNQYMQLVEGLSSLRTGMWLALPAVVMIASTMAAPVLARWVRPGYLVGVGLSIAGVGYLTVAQIDAQGGLAMLVTGLCIGSAGVGMAAALGNDLILASAPQAKVGSAAALSGTSVELGIALGVAGLGSVGTAVYRGHLDIPADLDGAAADQARESITGATQVAGSLPDASAATLLDSAQQAFTTGMTTVSGVAAALFVVLAVLAAVSLGRVRPAGREQPAPQADAQANAQADARADRESPVEIPA